MTVAFPAEAVAATLDGPTVTCALESHGCSRLARGAGGFDQHHPWPMDTGGPAAQVKVVLCPLHHRRQHSLVRYLVECDVAGTVPAWTVCRRFTVAERNLADAALADWQAAGRPHVTGWPCPAATEGTS